MLPSFGKRCLNTKHVLIDQKVEQVGMESWCCGGGLLKKRILFKEVSTFLVSLSSAGCYLAGIPDHSWPSRGSVWCGFVPGVFRWYGPHLLIRSRSTSERYEPVRRGVLICSCLRCQVAVLKDKERGRLGQDASHSLELRPSSEFTHQSFEASA